MGVGAATLGKIGGVFGAPAGQDLPIGIQLYTVRNLSKDDFKGTLTKVAAIGYRHFEFAGYGNLGAAELNAFLATLKATPCGSHEGFDALMNDPGKVIEFNRAIRNPFVVVPSMPPAVRKGSAADIEKFAQGLTRIGGEVKKAGMQLCYHNHSFEFEKVQGKAIWDILMSASDPDLVKAEVDLAWAFNAGVELVPFLEKFRNRIRLLHMKDLDSGKQLCPVGTGAIDWKPVVAKAKEIGVAWYIVEQDESRKGKDILDEIAISYRNLVTLLSA